MPFKCTFEIKCLSKVVRFHLVCQGKAIYLLRLEQRIHSLFLYMRKDAAGCVFSWMCMETLSHLNRRKCQSHMASTSTCTAAGLVLRARRTEGRSSPVLLGGKDSACPVWSPQEWAEQSTCSHLKHIEVKRVLKGHNHASEPEYSKKERKIKEAISK